MSRPDAATACLLLAALVAAPAVAQDESHLPLSIDADHGDLDLKAGRGRYWGHVSFARGTTRITADEVVLELVDGQLSSAVISGAPASFEQTVEGAAQPTRGTARTMTYRAADDIVELAGDARVVQAGDEVAGDLIRYDIKQQRVLAASTDAQGGRVQMTITPRKTKEPPPKEPPPPEPPAR